jgi:hypothetical protein
MATPAEKAKAKRKIPASKPTAAQKKVNAAAKAAIKKRDAKPEDKAPAVRPPKDEMAKKINVNHFTYMGHDMKKSGTGKATVWTISFNGEEMGQANGAHIGKAKDLVQELTGSDTPAAAAARSRAAPAAPAATTPGAKDLAYDPSKGTECTPVVQRGDKQVNWGPRRGTIIDGKLVKIFPTKKDPDSYEFAEDGTATKVVPEGARKVTLGKLVSF